jgi:hypothetical protein
MTRNGRLDRAFSKSLLLHEIEMEAALLSVPYQEAVSTFRTRQKMVCWMVARAGGAEKVR